MPAEPGPACAGVRLADRRLIFVRDVPPDLPAGATVRLRLDGVEQRGLVHIPPALLVWCDPDVPCSAFVALEPGPTQAPDAAPSGSPEPGWLLAADGAPDAATLRRMRALAWDERDRLDDPATPPRVRGPRPSAGAREDLA